MASAGQKRLPILFADLWCGFAEKFHALEVYTELTATHTEGRDGREWRTTGEGNDEAEFTALATRLGAQIESSTDSPTIPLCWIWLNEVIKHPHERILMGENPLSYCIPHVAAASAALCRLYEVRAREDERETTRSQSSGALPAESATASSLVGPSARQRRRSVARHAVVDVILQRKNWTPNRWGVEAGVGKNCPYEYLNGSRRLSSPNRKAMEQALDLAEGQLPND